MSDALPSVSSGPTPSSTAIDARPSAADANAEPNLRLTSSDDLQVLVSTAAAMVSQTLAGMIAANAGEDAKLTEEIHVPVECDVLEVVLQWCEQFKGQSFGGPKLDPYTRRYERLELVPWQRSFISNHQSNLWRLAIGANFLDVTSLYFAICCVVADVIDQEATLAQIASGDAVLRLVKVFGPREEQPTASKKKKTRDPPRSLPIDDAVPDDILVNIAQFITYDQLQACCKALPRWKAVADGNKRQMPREPLRSAKITSKGIIEVVSGSLDFGSSPGRTTRSKALGEAGLHYDKLSSIEGGNRRELEAVEDLWCYAVPELVVYNLKGIASKLFRDYIDAENAEAVRIKHLRIQHFDGYVDDDKVTEAFELLGAFITKIGGVERLSLPVYDVYGTKHADAIDAKRHLLPESIGDISPIRTHGRSKGYHVKKTHYCRRGGFESEGSDKNGEVSSQ